MSQLRPKTELPGETGTPTAYHITKYPQRKQVALSRHKGTVVRPIAYFTDEAYAREFMRWLDQLSGLEPSEEYHGWSIRRNS